MPDILHKDLQSNHQWKGADVSQPPKSIYYRMQSSLGAWVPYLAGQLSFSGSFSMIDVPSLGAYTLIPGYTASGQANGVIEDTANGLLTIDVSTTASPILAMVDWSVSFKTTNTLVDRTLVYVGAVHIATPFYTQQWVKNDFRHTFSGRFLRFVNDGDDIFIKFSSNAIDLDITFYEATLSVSKVL